jgi:hypothetical protein
MSCLLHNFHVHGGYSLNFCSFWLEQSLALMVVIFLKKYWQNRIVFIALAALLALIFQIINNVMSTIKNRIAPILMDIKLKTSSKCTTNTLLFGESLVLPLPIFPRVGYHLCICIWKQQGG